jgi:hypothetical protein
MQEPIVIVMEGGLVQGVLSRSGDGPPVVVIDYDTEGVESMRIKRIPQGLGFDDVDGYVSELEIEKLYPPIADWIDGYLSNEEAWT